MTAQILVVALQIADEDGPNFYLSLLDYEQWHTAIESRTPRGRTAYQELDSWEEPFNQAVLEGAQWDVRDLFPLLESQTIVDIVEIDDWYDLLSPAEVAERQARQFDRLVIPPHLQPGWLLTIVTYGADPSKYLVPEAVLRAVWQPEATPELLDAVQPYQVAGSYYDLIQSQMVLGTEFALFNPNEE